MGMAGAALASSSAAKRATRPATTASNKMKIVTASRFLMSISPAQINPRGADLR